MVLHPTYKFVLSVPPHNLRVGGYRDVDRCSFLKLWWNKRLKR